MIFIGIVVVCLLIGVKILNRFHDKFQKPLKLHKDYNVVMVHFYPLRADHLGCYGYTQNTSPGIDKLAKDSAVFYNNFSPNTLTLTAFTSIMCSLYPASHGVFYVDKDKLSFSIETLGEILKKYGYNNAWFADKKFLFMEGTGDRGFAKISYSDNLSELRENFISWLKQNKNRKFFVVLSSSDLHAPYYMETQYRKKYLDKFIKEKPEGLEVIESQEEFQKAIFKRIKEALLNPEDNAWKILDKQLINEPVFKNSFQGDYTPDKFHRYRSFMASKYKSYAIDSMEIRVHVSKLKEDIRAVKYGECLYNTQLLTLDTEIIKPLIKKLKQLSLYDNTVIIFCSSHGQEFFDHGQFGHGLRLYDELIRVPLIIKIPGIRKEKRIQELTSTVDILPTILDLLGIPIPSYAQGRSLKEFMVGKEVTKPLHDYIYGRTIYASSIRSKEWKLILLHEEAGTKELYHLISDPGEKHNLYKERKDVASELERELKKWEETLPSYVDREYPFSPEVDEAAQERIRKTGYW